MDNMGNLNFKLRIEEKDSAESLLYIYDTNELTVKVLDQINMGIQDTSYVNFTQGARVQFGANGYMQIINNNITTPITLDSIGLTNTTNVWVLNTHLPNIISTTDTKGIFHIASGYLATATSTSG
jgi:hypothetical protein